MRPEWTFAFVQAIVVLCLACAALYVTAKKNEELKRNPKVITCTIIKAHRVQTGKGQWTSVPTVKFCKENK